MQMNNKIVIDGLRFVQSGRPYFYCSAKRVYLHRYLWEKENGEIPDGYEIHHKDHDATNNDLNNLMLVSKEEHRSLHSNNLTDERRKFMRDNMNQNARPKAIEWHKSEKGKEWHKQHYEKTKHALHADKEFTCECCGISFKKVDTGANRFCSNKCKSKWRRIKGLDNIKKNCMFCDSEFEISKYSKTIYCSRSCSVKDRKYKR